MLTFGESVFRTKYNLNEISHDTAIGLVRRTVALGVDIKEVLSVRVYTVNCLYSKYTILCLIAALDFYASYMLQKLLERTKLCPNKKKRLVFVI